MKNILVLLLAQWVTTTLPAQGYCIAVDLLTQKHLEKISLAEKKQFYLLLAQRGNTNMLKRLDTATFTVAFIEESYCSLNDSIISTERYFNESAPDQLGEPLRQGVPGFVYINDIKQDPLHLYFSGLIPNGIHYELIDSYSLKENLIALASTLQPVQSLTYDSTLMWEGLRDVFDARQKEMTIAKEKELRHTWKIITFINKNSQQIIVSLQLPAVKPTITYTFFQRMYDW